MPAAASYPLVHTWSCISSPRLAHHQPDSHYQLLLPQAQMWQDPVAAKVHINSQGTQNCLWAWIQPCFLLLVHTTGLTCSELLQQCTCTPQPDFLHQPPLPGVRGETVPDSLPATPKSLPTRRGPPRGTPRVPAPLPLILLLLLSCFSCV